MSLYRKYRPKTLSEIVGQKYICQTFQNALQKKSLSHAYLFAGPRGTGKTSLARIIARALNCLNPTATADPCNTCLNCQEALQNNFVDLIEIDAASNRGIDEIRDLKSKIAFLPSRGKYKIYIIDEVHMLTKEAFNALLKTLEEPPAHAYFILATTEAYRVPETILSRCQRFDFRQIENSAMAERLAEIAQSEKISADASALAIIAKQVSGSLRDAISLLEQLSTSGKITTESVVSNLGLTRPETVDQFLQMLLAKKSTEALAIIDGVVEAGGNLIQFIRSVLGKLREVLLNQIQNNSAVEIKKLLIIIARIQQSSQEIRTSEIPQLPLECAVVEICQME